MKRAAATAVVLRAAGAVLWLGYVFLLARVLPAEDLGRVLYSLALAGLIGGLTTAGWAQWLLREGARRPEALADLWRQAIEAVVVRTVWAICLLPVVAVLGAFPPLMTDRLLLSLTLVNAVLITGLVMAAHAFRAQHRLARALALQGVVRLGLAILLAGAVIPFGMISAAAAVGLHAVALLLLVPFCLSPVSARRSGTVDRHCLQAVMPLSLGQGGTALFQHADIIAAGWLLPPGEAALYLVARRFAGFLGLLFDALRAALAPHVSVSFGTASRREFATVAARVNLGFLLIGGAGALGLLLAGRLLLGHFGTGFAAAFPAMFWLVIAQSAPAIFGATGMLMTMTDMEQSRAALVWLILSAGIVALAISGLAAAAQLALAIAILHLSLGAASAGLLGLKHGVWPGLTAVLHKGLRLL